MIGQTDSWTGWTDGQRQKDRITDRQKDKLKDTQSKTDKKI